MSQGRKKAGSSRTSFEEELKRLEEIVAALESETVTLEGALELFEEGTTIVKSAQKKLKESQLRVRKVLGEKEGEPVLGDFLLADEEGEGREESE